MAVLALVVAALFVGVVLVGVGDRLRLPWPVLLVLVGTGAAFVPGTDAPGTELVIIAAGVLVGTLVLPGLTLPLLLRALGVRESEQVGREAEHRIVLRARRAALTELAALDRDALGVDDRGGGGAG